MGGPNVSEREQEMSRQDLTIIIYCSVLFGGILYFVFYRVRKHNHPSRSVWLSFLLVLSVPTSVFLIPLLFLSIVDSTFHFTLNQPIIMGLAAVIVSSVIQAWRWCFKRIQSPARNEE